MPVYNESVEETFGRVETMARAIAAAGGAGWIDFFVLSDSERRTWPRRTGSLARSGGARRSRSITAGASRTSPASPAIAEWVRRFGACL
jgi:membrane glycosyltransferase